MNAIYECAPQNLLEVGATTYLKNVRSQMVQLLTRTDDSLRVQLGQVYAAAEYLRDDVDQWQAFCEQDEWLNFKGRPRATTAHQKNALKHAIRFAVGFDGAKANSTVHRYNNAMRGWWQEGVAAQEIPMLLEQNGGVEKMKRANADRGGLLLRLRENRHAKSINKETRQFDAIVVIRVFESADGIREAEIMTGIASVKKLPLIEHFEPHFEEWHDREIRAKKAMPGTRAPTL
ncbi:hypothetical protein ATY77_11725 [Rhizobium sp. R634]|uniref:hypothetical protein n=1 Tax=Rhizobium sp. R634 TaxID=1764274 RepID=UPI000B52AD93|nr:hypothetical protein [Rhizobium sp. R634]OWV72182.1 hypothetical protein ATY77_11725 [Rhizobium sp. R634]